MTLDAKSTKATQLSCERGKPQPIPGFNVFSLHRGKFEAVQNPSTASTFVPTGTENLGMRRVQLGYAL